MLGDHAYGENTWLRDRLDQAGCEYVLSVGPQTKVFEQGTAFAVPARNGQGGRAPFRPRPDRKPEPIGKLIGRLGADTTQTVTFRDGPDGEPVSSRFIFARVHAAHGWRDDQRRSGWREGAEVLPTRGMADRRVARRPRRADRLLDLKPARRHPARAAGTTRAHALEDGARLQAAQGRTRPGPLRRPLMARLGPHTALVTAPTVPHARAAEPSSPAAGLALPKAVLLLQPIFKCWTGHCQTCRRPVDLARLPLPLSRRDE